MAVDNWLIRMWPFIVISGAFISIVVVILVSLRLARHRPPDTLVADFRAWALVVVILQGVGAALTWRAASALSLIQVLLPLSWVGFVAWVLSCVHLVAVLRQFRADLRLRRPALAGYAIYWVLGTFGPLIALFAAPFILRWRARVSTR